MQKVNPIRRGFRGIWSFTPATGRSNAYKEWYAVCPDCDAEITPYTGWPHYNAGTRKSTKDALYRHRQEQHRPGSVGSSRESMTCADPTRAAGFDSSPRHCGRLSTGSARTALSGGGGAAPDSFRAVPRVARTTVSYRSCTRRESNPQGPRC